MTCKKNEIRAIDDLELKNVSGGSPFLVGFAILAILAALGVLASGPKS